MKIIWKQYMNRITIPSQAYSEALNQKDDRQCNGQKRYEKGTTNDIQNPIQETNDCTTQTKNHKQTNITINGRITTLMNHRVCIGDQILLLSKSVSRSTRSHCCVCRDLFYLRWFEVKGGCSFCWYWWNWWPSLVKSFFFLIILRYLYTEEKTYYI